LFSSGEWLPKGQSDSPNVFPYPYDADILDNILLPLMISRSQPYSKTLDEGVDLAVVQPSKAHTDRWGAKNLGAY
jgi:hypothetical protein